MNEEFFYPTEGIAPGQLENDMWHVNQINDIRSRLK